MQYINAFRRSGAMTATIADVGGQAGVLNAGELYSSVLRLTRMRRFWYRKRRIVDRFADRTCI